MTPNFIFAVRRAELASTIELIGKTRFGDFATSRFAIRALGAPPTRTLVVGCEPKVILGGEDYDDMLMELSEPVSAAVEEATKLVESLVTEGSTENEGPGESAGSSRETEVKS